MVWSILTTRAETGRCHVWTLTSAGAGAGAASVSNTSRVEANINRRLWSVNGHLLCSLMSQRVSSSRACQKVSARLADSKTHGYTSHCRGLSKCVYAEECVRLTAAAAIRRQTSSSSAPLWSLMLWEHQNTGFGSKLRRYFCTVCVTKLTNVSGIKSVGTCPALNR